MALATERALAGLCRDKGEAAVGDGGGNYLPACDEVGTIRNTQISRTGGGEVVLIAQRTTFPSFESY